MLPCHRAEGKGKLGDSARTMTPCSGTITGASLHAAWWLTRQNQLMIRRLFIEIKAPRSDGAFKFTCIHDEGMKFAFLVSELNENIMLCS